MAIDLALRSEALHRAIYDKKVQECGSQIESDCLLILLKKTIYRKNNYDRDKNTDQRQWTFFSTG